MNNPVSLINGDPNPTDLPVNALSALNETQNVREWLANEFTSFVTNNNISNKDVAHKVEVLMGTKMIAKMHNRKIENAFGLIYHHAMTRESIHEDFKLLYLYKVDLTDAACEAYLGNAGPSVQIMDVERKISNPTAHQISINVDKSVYTRFMMAMSAYSGSWLKNERDRANLGLPRQNDLDDPSLMLTRTEYNNFSHAIEIQTTSVTNALIKGDNTSSLFQIIRQSPSIYTLSKTKPFENVMDRCELVRRTTSLVPQRTFGLNKAGRITNTDRFGTSRILGEILCIYEAHTNNAAKIDDLGGWFEGPNAPFKSPDVVICTTSKVIDMLSRDGVCRTTRVNMNQIMTVVSLEQADMHPMRTVAPQNSVQFKNGDYVRDQNRQMIKKVHTTPDYKICYAEINGKNAVFVPVDDGSFAHKVEQDAKFTTMTTFDFMLPTGIAMFDHQDQACGPSRQSTSFNNEMGIQYTLSCDRLSKMLSRFFNDAEHATIRRAKRGSQVEESMMFYSLTDDSAGTEVVDQEAGGDDEHNTLGEETTYYRNGYMRNNHYYTSEVMVNNIISVILNQTSPVVRELIVETNHSEDKASSEPDDAVVNVVRDYFHRHNHKLEENLEKRVFSNLFHTTNISGLAMLKYINMGFGVIWLKPQFVQADSMLFCRPSGFAHFGGPPTQTRQSVWSDESKDVMYNNKAYSTTNRMSMGGYPSVMWHNAAMIESQVTSTDRVINTTDTPAVTEALQYLKATRGAGVQTKTFNPTVKHDGWWPLMAPPFMNKSFFSQVTSPLGRFGTPFATPDEHHHRFFDTNLNDCIHTNVFTANSVFNDMLNNFNTTVLYSNELFTQNEEFPFYKYMNFNPTASAGLNAFAQSITRTNNDTINMRRNDEEGVTQTDETNLSHLLGAAIPKTCWSNSEINGVLERKDIKNADSYRQNATITTGDTCFFINGHDFVGKWDRCAVGEYSFL